MSQFQRNLQFLNASDPELAQEIQTYGHVVIPAVEAAKKGGLTIKVGGQYVHSRYAPEAEALKWTRGETAGTHLHFGFGLGFGVRADKPQDGGCIVVYEPFPALFLATLQHCDLQEIYAHKQVRVRFQLEEVTACLVKAPGRDGKIAVRANPFHTKVAPQQWSALRKTVESVVLRRTAALETLQRSSAKFTESALLTMPLLMREPNINCLKGKYQGVPAVVVAAGPSLDRNLAHLSAISEKAIIICISRSAKPLERWHIAPDFLLHNEAQDYLHLIQGCTHLQQTAFVLDSQVHPRFARFPAQARFLYHSNVNFALPWLAQILPNYAAAALETAGSVANEAFSFALHLGCDPVVVVGQDLALTGGAYYAQAPTNQAFSHSPESVMAIDGYFGQPLPTLATYKAFALWFGAQAYDVSKHGSAQLVNATEGGAKLAHFEQQKLAQLALRFQTLPAKPKHLAQSCFTNHRHRVKPQAVRKFLLTAVKELTDLQRHCQQFQNLSVTTDLMQPSLISKLQKLEKSIQDMVLKYGLISGFIQGELQEIQTQTWSDDLEAQLRGRVSAYVVIARGAFASQQVLRQVLQQLS